MKRNIVIAKHAAKDDISLLDQSLHPFLMITDERFPRVMITRRLSDRNADYFGPFLPETAVRFFLDKISRMFKYRTCLIDIDGSFDVPCPQFYAKRCLAPCVRSLCGEEEYFESIELVKLFLSKEKEIFREHLTSKIETFAAGLDFESAAELRDLLDVAEELWEEKRTTLWLDRSTDTWGIERRGDRIFVFLVTMRGQKTLGKRVFAYDFHNRMSDAEVLESLLQEFYQVHAPGEIRVPADFADRKLYERVFSERERRNVKITVINEKNEKITSIRALARNKFEFDLRNVVPPVAPGELKNEIRSIFKLKKIPARIECFDTAHISGTDSAGAAAVWINGRFQTELYKFWLLDELAELESLAESIRHRFAVGDLPDLILIDGGISHLNAAKNALAGLPASPVPVVSAVKPPKRHGEISHFLLESGDRIPFDERSAACNVLKQIRDEAHLLANSVHGISRDFSYFYEAAAYLPSLNEDERRRLLKRFGSVRELRAIDQFVIEKEFGARIANQVVSDLDLNREGGTARVMPLVVPCRYDDPNGDARYLQPLKTYKS